MQNSSREGLFPSREEPFPSREEAFPLTGSSGSPGRGPPLTATSATSSLCRLPRCLAWERLCIHVGSRPVTRLYPTPFAGDPDGVGLEKWRYSTSTGYHLFGNSFPQSARKTPPPGKPRSSTHSLVSRGLYLTSWSSWSIAGQIQELVEEAEGSRLEPVPI